MGSFSLASGIVLTPLSLPSVRMIPKGATRSDTSHFKVAHYRKDHYSTNRKVYALPVDPVAEEPLDPGARKAYSPRARSPGSVSL